MVFLRVNGPVNNRLSAATTTHFWGLMVQATRDLCIVDPMVAKNVHPTMDQYRQQVKDVSKCLKMICLDKGQVQCVKTLFGGSSLVVSQSHQQLALKIMPRGSSWSAISRIPLWVMALITVPISKKVAVSTNDRWTSNCRSRSSFKIIWVSRIRLINSIRNHLF